MEYMSRAWPSLSDQECEDGLGWLVQWWQGLTPVRQQTPMFQHPHTVFGTSGFASHRNFVRQPKYRRIRLEPRQADFDRRAARRQQHREASVRQTARGRSVVTREPERDRAVDDRNKRTARAETRQSQRAIETMTGRIDPQSRRQQVTEAQKHRAEARYKKAWSKGQLQAQA
eukprot:2764171-Amphidinium_carterae.4